MSNDLFAYIDPVSGVILVQMIIGGCIGLIGFFRRSIGHSLSRLARSLLGHKAATSPDEAEPVILRLSDARFATQSLHHAAVDRKPARAAKAA